MEVGWLLDLASSIQRLIQAQLVLERAPAEGRLQGLDQWAVVPRALVVGWVPQVLAQLVLEPGRQV